MVADFQERLAEQLRDLRASYYPGKTQLQVSRLAGIGLRQIRELEQGTGNPQLNTIVKLLHLYDVTLAVVPHTRADTIISLPTQRD